MTIITSMQASYFIFSPFEAIFASSKFYKVARIYWAVALGTIHLRRRHVLGGRGQKFAKFADG